MTGAQGEPGLPIGRVGRSSGVLKGLRAWLRRAAESAIAPVRRGRGAGPVRLVWIVTQPTSAAILLRGQLRSLRRHGFDVSVIASPGPELGRVADREGVAVWGLPIPPVGDHDAFPGAVHRIARTLRRIRPIVVVAGTLPAAGAGLLAARLARVPVRIYTLCDLPLETASGPARHAIEIWERRAVRCAHEVFAVSESLRRKHRALGLDPREKARVLRHGSGNGVDTERFRPAAPGDAERTRASLSLPADAPVLGLVARLVPNKGIADLVEVLDRVRAVHPRTHLLLVGARPPVNAVGDRVMDRLERDPHVRLAGHVEDTAPYYRTMDLLVFPSHREGFPNAVLEASATGLPIVGYGATGTVDAVVDGETGTLVPVGDAAGLAEAAIRYLDSPDVASAHGRAGRARVLQRYRREDVWSAVRAALQESVERRARPALDDAPKPVRPTGRRSEVRRVVWTAWFQGEARAPRVVQSCFASWRRENPGWEVRVLDETTLGAPEVLAEDVDFARHLPLPARSDVLRVNLLRRHGGVWADASCLCRTPLDAWLPDVLAPEGFFGFDRPAPDRKIASWFLAAEPGHVLVRRWCTLVNDFWRDHPRARVQSLEENAAMLDAADPAAPPPWLDVARWATEGEVPYFWLHYLFAHMIETDDEVRRAWSRVPKRTADPPHLFCTHGYERPVDEALRAAWNDGLAPLYKLTWRTDAPPGSAVAFAIEEGHW